MGDPPLNGLHVLELATGIAGPYAGRLFAMLGATVVKVEPPAGDPARNAAVDHRPNTGLSPLYVHLNAGKRLAVPTSDDELRQLVAWADVVIDDRLRADLRASGILEAAERVGALVVSVTPFGVDGDLASRIEHDVLAQARSGLIGIQGNPGAEPLRLPGWQAQYQAGATAAVGALAALRLPGARHLDVSWLASLLTASELHLADGIVSGLRRRPVGPFPTTAFPGGALPCADGFVVPGSFREIDWEMQAALYGMPELLDDDRFRPPGHARAAHRDELWDLIRPWYAERTKQEIFDIALASPWTVGKILTGSDALTDPHLAERGFLGSADILDGVHTVPLRPFRTARACPSRTNGSPRCRTSGDKRPRPWRAARHPGSSAVARAAPARGDHCVGRPVRREPPRFPRHGRREVRGSASLRRVPRDAPFPRQRALVHAPFP